MHHGIAQNHAALRDAVMQMGSGCEKDADLAAHRAP